MATDKTDILVFADWLELKEAKLIGILSDIKVIKRVGAGFN